ncbi:hypothetical protein [Kitasatospora terrestris]|uniref:Lipoprotein n=1 Tax=Kitasatospora terrestris TaxID=258051 RepID=A0ABP9EHF2_9ACTN
MGSGRILGTLALAGCALLGAAGCGESTEQAAAPAPNPTGENGVAELSAQQLVGRSVQALKEGRSARAAGSLTSEGEQIGLDLALDTGANCAGTMTLGPDGGFALVKIGNDLWIKPDAAFWATHGGSAVSDLVGDRYLRTTADDADFADVASLCDLDDLADSIGRNAVDVAKGPRTTLRGIPAVTVTGRNEGEPGTLYVATEGRPYPLRLEKATGPEVGGIDFTDFGVPVPAAAPPPDRSVDLDELRRRTGSGGGPTTV